MPPTIKWRRRAVEEVIVKWGVCIVALAVLGALTLMLAGCTQGVKFRSAESAVSGKRPHLDQRTVYVSEPRDTRANRASIGEHYQAQDPNGPQQEGPSAVKTMDYTSEVGLPVEVRQAFEQAFKAGGATVVSSPGEADLQVQVEIQKFFVVTTAMYSFGPDGTPVGVTETTKGDVALQIAVLDGKGFEMGKVPASSSFDESGDQPELLAVTLNQVVAEVVDNPLVVQVATAAAAADAAATADANGTEGGAEGVNGDDGAKNGKWRVYLRYAGDNKLSKTLSAKGVYFQGPILERGTVEFAGTSEMDDVYKSLCADMGVTADEERKCRLQAAQRIFVQEIIELGVRQPDKGSWEITMEVWNPETNGLVSAKGVKLPAASVEDAIEAALPQLACAYLVYRGETAPCALQ